jgi:chromosome segregation protein
MYLKRLEAFGFKSFADKTVFDFEQGFTCLVGPNGCGKSNIVDSIKWVLGEQSAKSLRGGEMLDVIFNGSAHRKPLNYCEVMLVFDNADGVLPLAAPEVAVGRRLYRSGESEYLINKAACRLRDVRELLWDTGIGTSSYSIIEQGRIGLLLESNNKERRVLFEEAAGIHKYKERKKIALRKLERVEQNLARLNDVMGEVERNLRSVTRQAARARRAKELTDKLQHIRLDVLLHQTHTSQTALREVEGELNGAREHVAALAEQLNEARCATQADEASLARLDQALSETQSRLADARTELATLEESLKAERRAVEGMRAEAARARELAGEAGNRAAAIANEREKAELDLQRVQESLGEREKTVEMLTEVLAKDQAEHEELTRKLDETRRHGLDVIGRRTQLQQSFSKTEAAISGIDYRLRKAKAQVTRAGEQLRLAQSEAESVRSRLDEVQRRRESLETEQGNIRALQARAEDESESLTARAQELRGEMERHRSRIAVLEDLQQSGDGLSPGTRAVLTDLRTEGLDGGDLHGLAADVLGVEPRLEVAIEAALGASIEALVVGHSDTANRLIDRLRDDGLGRALFLPLDRLQGIPQAGLPEGAPLPGLLGRASDLVQFDPAHAAVAVALLGDVLVFESTQHALAAREYLDAASHWRLVTLDGALMEPSGALGGGQFRKERLGLLGRRNEITRLNVLLDELRLKLQALAERSAHLENRAQRLARDDERIGSDLSALAVTATELKGILTAVQREESRSNEEQEIASSEIHQLETERDSFAASLSELDAELTQLKQEEEQTRALAEELARNVEFRGDALTRRRSTLEEVRREVSTLKERAGGLERHGQALSAQFAERRDEADRETRRAESLDERCTTAETECAEKDALRGQTAERISLLDGETRHLGGAKEQARQRFEGARAKEKALGEQLEQTRAQCGEIERREVELKLRLDQKLESARTEFQIDIVEELARRGGPPELTPDAVALVQELNDKLQKLGPVNMFALEEQRQLEERATFLKTQSEDLNSARASLRDVIARINRRSRKQFQDTFEAVRLHFQEIFRKLFGGGKADLLLEENEDILDAGIDIVARPPGKEPRSIMQLSGGEKALTTIALLFAVFRSRPAPFCLLDEVDAPLDEANVDRFNMILREFMDQSQFLVITHNKKTMSYADTLYGVTMPEPGVSKRIAIKYAEIEKHLPMEQIEAEAEAKREAAQEVIAEAKPSETTPVAEEEAPVAAGGE